MANFFNLSEKNNIAQRFIGELRDVNVQNNRMRFRRNLERIGEILAYELSKTLDYKIKTVETPLGEALISEPTQKIVLGTILRAGLPLHQGFLNYFDDADNAFIAAYRKHKRDGSFEISLEYVSCPDLTDTTLIMIDPMLATGASMSITLQQLERYGKPAAVHIVAAIGSRAGLEHIQRIYPNAKIWLGALDEELTAKSYIVPGLGDAGDLSYGDKMQR
jgi:uracil phosphoribosyltransferase